MRTSHMVILLLTSIFGGGNFVAVKIAVAEVPPIMASAVRFVLALIILLPFLKIIKGKMKAVFLTAINTAVLNFSLMYMAFARADDVSVLAIVVQATVPISTIMAVIFLGERIGWRRVVAIAGAFAGIIVIGFEPRVIEYGDAVLLALASVLIFSVGLIQIRKLGNVPAMTFLGWQAVLAAPVQIILSLLLEDGQLASLLAASTPVILALLYTAVFSTLFVHAGFIYVLQRNPISRVMPFTLLAPLFGVLFSIMFLGEALTTRMIVGGLLTFAGVTFITFRNREEIEAVGGGEGVVGAADAATAIEATGTAASPDTATAEGQD